MSPSTSPRQGGYRNDPKGPGGAGAGGPAVRNDTPIRYAVCPALAPASAMVEWDFGPWAWPAPHVRLVCPDSARLLRAWTRGEAFVTHEGELVAR